MGKKGGRGGDQGQVSDKWKKGWKKSNRKIDTTSRPPPQIKKEKEAEQHQEAKYGIS